MPDYTYTDTCGHVETHTQPMFYSTGVICAACGLRMWRKPQLFSVTWGGLRPSQGELSPVIQQVLDTTDERRDAYYERHGED